MKEPLWENVGLCGKTDAFFGDGIVFQGTTLHALDAKGRLAVPARHRAVFAADGEGGVVLTRHPDGCLVLYAESVWAERRSRLMKLPHEARALVRFVLGGATELRFDAAGRLLIPSDLRTLAGLERECVLVGLGDHLELWNADLWRRTEADALAEGMCSADFTF